MHQALHGDVRRALAHHGHCLVDGGPLVGLVDDLEGGGVLAELPQQRLDLALFADEHRVGHALVHGHQHRFQGDVVVGAGHGDFLAAGVALHKGFHLFKRSDLHSSKTSSLPISA